mmetsp:Transcript_97235/g.231362  ORF Transcript_97235/g.231362 Transcript_97235/m.231362 type:complete len:314 (+) Transcript_97235:2266-3207(+)
MSTRMAGRRASHPAVTLHGANCSARTVPLSWRVMCCCGRLPSGPCIDDHVSTARPKSCPSKETHSGLGTGRPCCTLAMGSILTDPGPLMASHCPSCAKARPATAAIWALLTVSRAGSRMRTFVICWTSHKAPAPPRPAAANQFPSTEKAIASTAMFLPIPCSSRKVCIGIALLVLPAASRSARPNHVMRSSSPPVASMMPEPVPTEKARESTAPLCTETVETGSGTRVLASQMCTSASYDAVAITAASGDTTTAVRPCLCATGQTCASKPHLGKQVPRTWHSKLGPHSQKSAAISRKLLQAFSHCIEARFKVR